MVYDGCRCGSGSSATGLNEFGFCGGVEQKAKDGWVFLKPFARLSKRSDSAKSRLECH